MSFPIEKTDAQWKAELAAKAATGQAEALAYHVTRKAATERAFTGKYESCKLPGVYRCICCDHALFESDDKYESAAAGRLFSRRLASKRWARIPIFIWAIRAPKFIAANAARILAMFFLMALRPQVCVIAAIQHLCICKPTSQSRMRG